MHSPWLANKSRLLPRSCRQTLAGAEILLRVFSACFKIVLVETSYIISHLHLGRYGKEENTGNESLSIDPNLVLGFGIVPREHRSACGESTAVLCCPKQADSVPLSAAQADEETGETEGVMRYEMSGSVGMDGGVSAVVGSQAWVVSLEETGGTRAPTFSSFSVSCFLCVGFT